MLSFCMTRSHNSELAIFPPRHASTFAKRPRKSLLIVRANEVDRLLAPIFRQCPNASRNPFVFNQFPYHFPQVLYLQQFPNYPGGWYPPPQCDVSRPQICPPIPCKPHALNGLPSIHAPHMSDAQPKKDAKNANKKASFRQIRAIPISHQQSRVGPRAPALRAAIRAAPG